jgi:glucose/arabinose dehydrogenase
MASDIKGSLGRWQKNEESSVPEDVVGANKMDQPNDNLGFCESYAGGDRGTNNLPSTQKYCEAIPVHKEMTEQAGRKFKPARFTTMLSLLLTAAACLHGQDNPAAKLTPRRITLQNGKSFSLNVPEEFEISVAAEGLKRVRFMAKAPDERIFVTDMYNRADNKRGVVYSLGRFDEKNGKFEKVLPYLSNLRNPNSLAFYTNAKGQKWMYLALTDKLVRYKFRDGEESPGNEPEVLAIYPDYGLNYKYGGWHLTRTIVFGQGDNRDQLYVSVGSSCNACEEKEEIRATLSVMDADGKNARIIGLGLRNAVGLRVVEGALYLTNMGADHLGDDAPDDPMFVEDKNALQGAKKINYGWPYCYFEQGKVTVDPQFGDSARKAGCGDVPAPYATFAAHSSPLGLEYFGSNAQSPVLREHFLVALHGAGHKRLKRGYRVVRVTDKGTVEDFITGFLQSGVIYGRPCDVLRLGTDSFLLTDDYAGVIYYVRRR